MKLKLSKETTAKSHKHGTSPIVETISWFFNDPYTFLGSSIYWPSVIIIDVPNETKIPIAGIAKTNKYILKIYYSSKVVIEVAPITKAAQVD